MTSYKTSDGGPSLWGREPALILAVIQAAIALAVGFGLNLTAEQVSLITALVAAIIGVVIRRQVWSPASVQEIADDPWHP